MVFIKQEVVDPGQEIPITRPIISLGIQTEDPQNVTFTINGSSTPLHIGRTKIYELEVDKTSALQSIVITNNSSDTITIVDYAYYVD